jgi:hypothetical protein
MHLIFPHASDRTAEGVALHRAKSRSMNEHQASRTLLKSPPELWAECSDAQSLARHLGESVGEIQITRLEPQSTVAWEGDRTSGTVKLEPSGWGTRVTLTCSTAFGEEVGRQRPASGPEPEPGRPPQSDGPPQPGRPPLSGRPPQSDWPPRSDWPPDPNRAPDPDRPPEREPEPLSPGREADSASVAEQPPSPPAGGGLFTRVMRFLAAQRTVAEPAAPAPAAQPPAPEPVAPEPQPPEPPAAPESSAPAEGPPPAAEPAPAEERGAAESAVAAPSEPTESADVLAAALESLGQAHHRPFSRA